MQQSLMLNAKCDTTYFYSNNKKTKIPMSLYTFKKNIELLQLRNGGMHRIVTWITIRLPLWAGKGCIRLAEAGIGYVVVFEWWSYDAPGLEL